MSEAEAIAHIKAADADGNMAIDFAEFGKLWEALHGAEEVGKIESCQRTFAKLYSARKRPLLKNCETSRRFVNISEIRRD